MSAPTDRHFRLSQRAARHSREAHTLLQAERGARRICRDLLLVNFFTKGGFEAEIERVEKLAKRIGAKRRRIMKGTPR
ncbi:MAG: hypothetical protein DI537_20405 [Stutzerimonas stutzeri]|nr:MAG: hypothetical protein DI537_20405 [Stutzerimonas stutzeri]